MPTVSGDGVGCLLRGVWRAIEDDGDGSIIEDGDLHIGLKDAGFDVDTETSHGIAKEFVEGFGEIGWCGVDEAWATSFGAIGVEGELADSEHGSVGVLEGEVHFSIWIGEDAKAGNFFGEVAGILWGVLVGDTEEDG